MDPTTSVVRINRASLCLRRVRDDGGGGEEGEKLSFTCFSVTGYSPCSRYSFAPTTKRSQPVDSQLNSRCETWLGTHDDDTLAVIHDDTTSEFLDNRPLRTTLLSRVFMRRSEFAENGRVAARAPERPPKTAEGARGRSSRHWRGHAIGPPSMLRRAHWSVWTAERYRRPIAVTSNLFCGRLTDIYMSFDIFGFFYLHFLSRCFVFLFPRLISF